MNTKKITTLLLPILAIVIIATGVWYARKPAQETPPADGEAIGEVVDNIDDGLSGSEVDTSDWKTFWIEDLGIYFKYPDNFILLNRWYKQEKNILISDKEIEFNEFLNRYDAPITIGKSSELDSNFINNINQKNERNMIVGGNNVTIIKGIYDNDEPYKNFDTIIALIDDKNFYIRGNSVRSSAGGDINFDLDVVLSQILTTLKFD